CRQAQAKPRGWAGRNATRASRRSARAGRPSRSPLTARGAIVRKNRRQYARSAPGPPPPMIELENLEKSYGETRALKGVSSSIARGQVVGLLGPNGAGKTTTIKIIVGYLLPSAGRATVAGYDVVAHPLEVQKRIGYLPENAPLYLDMLAQEYLEFMADMRELDLSTRRRRLARLVEERASQPGLARPIGRRCKGYRQRVGLAAALLHDPGILILDEPTTGLDPNQIVEVRQLIRRMASRKTVILSTHILPEVEATCDRAVILIDGRVRAD